MSLKTYYEYQDSAAYKMIPESQIHIFKYLFKTKKSFNEWKKSLLSRRPAPFTKGCKKYYIKELFRELYKQVKNFAANDFKPKGEWFENDFAPNFDKEAIEEIFDIDINPDFGVELEFKWDL